MNNSLFRKKNLDRISSPDQLNDYIKVSNPSVWLVLGALIIVAIAFSIWANFGKITSEISATGVFQGSSRENVDYVVCYVDANDKDKIHEGMPVRIYDKTKGLKEHIMGKVSKVSNKVIKQEDILSSYASEYIADSILESEYGLGVVISINKTPGGGYEWEGNESGDDSFIVLNNLCKVDIIFESIAPIDFLFNQSA